MVGRISLPDTGVAEYESGLIPGPETIRGTRIPPSKASHLPLLKG